MTNFLVQGRPWDSFDAYLFDIDGTLLHCSDAVHYFAFCESLQTLSGRPLTLEGVTAHGNTDVGILRDALALAGVTEREWRPRLPEIRDAMCRFVNKHQHDLRATALPSVLDVLDHLRNKGATLGIATGNLREIGRLKLQSAGVLDYFALGGWSDEYESRADVFREAVSLMYTATFADASICFVGDTPADVLAAHSNGLPVIAVATGVYSSDELKRYAPDLCLQSLADLGAA
jgi:phosphoglycolate phosphatase